MKKTLLFSAAFLSIVLVSVHAFTRPTPVMHVVVFKYKSTAAAADIKAVTDAFVALRHKIPGIRSFQFGTNNSTENLNKGFTHAYVITFENTQARDAYLSHPEHKKFVEMLTAKQILEEPFVIDFEIQNVE